MEESLWTELFLPPPVPDSNPTGVRSDSSDPKTLVITWDVSIYLLTSGTCSDPCTHAKFNPNWFDIPAGDGQALPQCRGLPVQGVLAGSREAGCSMEPPRRAVAAVLGERHGNVHAVWDQGPGRQHHRKWTGTRTCVRTLRRGQYVTRTFIQSTEMWWCGKHTVRTSGSV